MPSIGNIIGDLNVRNILYVGRTRERLDTRAEQHRLRPGREDWILTPIFVGVPNVNEAFVLQQILIEAFANQLNYNSRYPVYRAEIDRIGEAFRIDSTELWRFMGRGGVGDIDTRNQAYTLASR